METVPRPDWPEAGGFWDEMEFAVAAAGPEAKLTLANAQEAARRLVVQGFPYPDKLTKGLLEALHELWKAQDAATRGGPAGSREEALAASRGCQDCGGKEGVVVRYRHASIGQAHEGRTVEPTVRLLCLCPLGRWMEATLRSGGVTKDAEAQAEAKAARKRMHDLADHPNLQLGPVPWSEALDNRYRYPPELWDGFNDCPMPVEAETLSDFTAEYWADPRNRERVAERIASRVGVAKPAF
jgi:hypothetical protein